MRLVVAMAIVVALSLTVLLFKFVRGVLAVLGLTGRERLGLVLMEATVLGLLGSGLGLALAPIGQMTERRALAVVLR